MAIVAQYGKLNNAAYEVLSEPDRRAVYDTQLQAARAAQAAAREPGAGPATPPAAPPTAAAPQGSPAPTTTTGHLGKLVLTLIVLAIVTRLAGLVGVILAVGLWLALKALARAPRARMIVAIAGAAGIAWYLLFALSSSNPSASPPPTVVASASAPPVPAAAPTAIVDPFASASARSTTTVAAQTPVDIDFQIAAERWLRENAAFSALPDHRSRLQSAIDRVDQETGHSLPGPELVKRAGALAIAEAWPPAPPQASAGTALTGEGSAWVPPPPQTPAEQRCYDTMQQAERRVPSSLSLGAAAARFEEIRSQYRRCIEQ